MSGRIKRRLLRYYLACRRAWDHRGELLFGYDYFIAYRSTDGKVYAQALHTLLTAEGNDLHCFLDVRHYGAGSSLPWMQRRALRATTRLLVVVSPESHHPHSLHVLNEVRQFRHFHPAGKVVPIGSLSTLTASAYPESRLMPLIPHLPNAICILEAAPAFPATSPSTPTLQKLLNDFTEERRGVRRRKRLAQLCALLATLLVLAVLAGSGFLVQWQRADTQARMALSKGLALEARNTGDKSPLYGTLLAAQATKEHPTPEALELLGAMLAVNRSVTATRYDGAGSENFIVPYGDDSSVIYESKTGLTQWTPATGKEQLLFASPFDGPLQAHPQGPGLIGLTDKSLVLLKADGTTISLAPNPQQAWPHASTVGLNQGTPWVAWTALDKELCWASIGSSPRAHSKLFPEVENIDALTTTENGTHLLMATRRLKDPSAEVSEWVSELHVIDSATSERKGNVVTLANARIDALVSSESGTVLAAMSGTLIHLVDQEKRVHTLERQGFGMNHRALAISKDGTWLAWEERTSGKVTLCDLRGLKTDRHFSLQTAPMLPFNTGNSVLALKFLNHGAMLAALCEDGTLWSWQLAGADTVQVLTTPENHGWDLTLVNNASGLPVVISALNDGAALFRPPFRIIDEAKSPLQVAVGKDWALRDHSFAGLDNIMSSNSHRKTRLERLADGHSFVISPAGAGLFRVSEAGEKQRLAADDTSVDFLSASSLAPYIATASGSTFIIRCALQPDPSPRTHTTDGAISSIALSPDGKLVAVGRKDGVLEVRVATTGKVLHQWSPQASSATPRPRATPSPRPIRSVAWSPTGGSLIWSHERHLHRSRVAKISSPEHTINLPAYAGPIAWHPGDKWIACGLKTGPVLVLDSKTLQKARELPAMERQETTGLAFSLSGDLLAIGAGHGTQLHVWQTVEFEPQRMLQRARQILGRNFSLREWENVVGPIKPYEKTFDTLPYGEGVAP